MHKPDADPQGTTVIIGNSVRYLAQSAYAAGDAVVGIDAFNDIDMQAACRRAVQAAAMTASALATAFKPLILEQSPASPLSWVYTSGFEPDAEVLAQLHRRAPGMLGNEAKVMQVLADPIRLFRLLDTLAIAYPQTHSIAPIDTSDWLFKPAGGYGGVGIKPANAVPRGEPGGYFQQRIDGPLWSLLFAADGRDVAVIGFNRLTVNDAAAGDYRFSTAIGGLRPAEAAREAMVLAAQRLTKSLTLRGVNGIDFVLDGDHALLLDINARPPATLELYEQVLPDGGWQTHLAACRGELPEEFPFDQRVRGMQVMYCEHARSLVAFEWPQGVTDLPPPGTQLHPDMPLCTVHAEASGESVVRRELYRLAHEVRRQVVSHSEAAA